MMSPHSVTQKMRNLVYRFVQNSIARPNFLFLMFVKETCLLFLVCKSLSLPLFSQSLDVIDGLTHLPLAIKDKSPLVAYIT
jgi:hypothetical protein